KILGISHVGLNHYVAEALPNHPHSDVNFPTTELIDQLNYGTRNSLSAHSCIALDPCDIALELFQAVFEFRSNEVFRQFGNFSINHFNCPCETARSRQVISGSLTDARMRYRGSKPIADRKLF